MWALGVVIFQYGYGLPRPSRKRKGKPWCRDIVKAVEDMEGEGDALIDLISTRMLRMDYRDRQSASDCLGEVYRLGFHMIRTVEVGRTTPRGNTTSQDGVTRPKSVVTQLCQNGSPDVSSGFYDLRGASEIKEVAPSKRDLRAGVHFQNRASPPSLDRHPQGLTQMWKPQTEDAATLTRSKRRRPQTIQSPMVDAVGRGQSKRSRAFDPREAGEQLPKTSNPKPGPEQLERSISSNHEGALATDIATLNQDIEPILQGTPEAMRKRTRPPSKGSPALASGISRREIEEPSSKRNIQDQGKAMLVGDENEAKAKVRYPG